eukprot:Nk52_evm29s270 gene=Nk52_evmTU29s270
MANTDVNLDAPVDFSEVQSLTDELLGSHIARPEVYEKIWVNIFRLLRSQEPTERCYGLVKMLKCSDAINRDYAFIISDAKEFTKCLLGIAINDEIETNRLLALRVSGSYYSLLQTKFPLANEYAFECILKFTQTCFPHNYYEYNEELIRADKESSEWKSLCKRRQYAICTLTYFAECPEAKTESTESFINLIIHEILSDTDGKTIFLQSQALNFLSSLKFTAKNRERIFQFYPAVIELDPNQFIEGTSSIEEPVHPVLATALSKFWSVWYPKTPDEILMALPEDTMHKHLFGYAQRRLKELEETLVEAEEDEEGDALEDDEEEESESSDEEEGPAEQEGDLPDDAIYKGENALHSAGSKLKEVQDEVKEGPVEDAVPESISSEPAATSEAKKNAKAKERKAIAAAKKKRAAIKALSAVNEKYKSVKKKTEDSRDDKDATEDYKLGEPIAEEKEENNDAFVLKDEEYDRLLKGEIESIPEPGVLSFNLGLSGVIFDDLPYTRMLKLSNKSNKQQKFRIQTSHPEFFSIIPSYGFVEARSYKDISVTFKPVPHTYPMKVDGFFRVRTPHGFPLERIPLTGYHGPFLEVKQNSINFGPCPLADSRAMKIAVKNDSIIPVNSTVEVYGEFGQSDDDVPFTVHPKQRFIPADETKEIEVTFRPLTKGVVKGVVFISCMGSEKYKIPLLGTGGDSLSVMEDILDFGPTECTDVAYTKQIHIHNRDLFQKIPVKVAWQAKQINIIGAGNGTIMMQPGEKMTLQVEFLPTRSGKWSDSVTLTAANCSPIVIELVSYVGPFIGLLSAQEIHLPSTMSGRKSAITVPFSNYLDVAADANLFFPPDTPFSFFVEPLEDDSANDISMVVFNDNEASGLTLTIGPHMILKVNIVFDSPVSGVFRVPFTLALLKPYNIQYPPYMINAICFDDDFYFDKPQSELQSLVSKPEEVDAKTNLTFADMEKFDRASKTVYTEMFRITPSTIFLCIRTDGNTYGNCVLSNLTDSRRQYKLFVSAPFKLDIPMEGTIDSEGSISIVVTMNVPKTSQKMYFGMLSCVDVDENVVCSIEVKGVNGHAIDLDFPSKDNCILFPRTSPRTKVEKQIFLENKSSYPVRWELHPAGNKGVKGKSPFLFSNSNGTLSPFETLTLTTTFSSAIKGEYKAEFSVSYIHPLLEEEEWFSYGNFICHAIVGNAELQLDIKSVDYGSVFLGHTAKRFVNVTNPSSQEADVALIVPKYFQTDSEEILIEPKGQHKITILFNPTGTTPVSGFMALLHGGETFNIPLSGRGSTIDIHNLSYRSLPYGNPLGYRISDKLPVGCNKGIVATCNAIYFEETFTNTGTMKYIISNISSSNTEILTWSLGPSVDKADNSENNEEIDWDELQYRKHEQLKRKLNERKEALLLTPGERTRRASQMIENGYDANSIKEESQSLSKEDLEYLSIVEYPMVLSPYQTLTLTLKFLSSAKGHFSPLLHFWSEVSDSQPFEKISFQYDIEFQPSLVVDTTKVEFGICGVGIQQSKRVSFKNLGDIPVRWEILPITIAKKQSTKALTSKMITRNEDDSEVFNAFPMTGKLSKGGIQTLDVVFRPAEPHCYVKGNLVLTTENLGNFSVSLCGIGAIASLLTSTDSLEFGIIKVFAMKSKRFRITNQGQLSASFFIRVSNPCFQVMPEQGRIGGEEAITIEVQFIPSKEGAFSTELEVTWSNQPVGCKVIMPISGGGGFPDIEVFTENVDFGTALLGVENVKTIRLYNKGNAEAVVVGLPESADVTLKSGRLSDLNSKTVDYEAMAVLGAEMADAIGSGVGQRIDAALASLMEKHHTFDSEDAIHIGKNLISALASRSEILIDSWSTSAASSVVCLKVNDGASLGCDIGDSIDQDIRITAEGHVLKKVTKKGMLKYLETFGLDILSSINPSYIDKDMQKGKLSQKGAENIGKRIMACYGRSFMEKLPSDTLGSLANKISTELGLTNKDSDNRNFFGPSNVLNIEKISATALAGSCLSLIGPSVASVLLKKDVKEIPVRTEAIALGLHIGRNVARKEASGMGFAFANAIGVKIGQILDGNVAKSLSSMERGKRVKYLLNFGFKALKIMEKYYDMLSKQPDMIEQLSKRIVSEILLILDGKVHDIVDDKSRVAIGICFIEKKHFEDKEVLDILKLTNDDSVVVEISLSFALALVGSFGVGCFGLFKENASRALAKNDLPELLAHLEEVLDSLYHEELGRRIVFNMDGELSKKIEKELLSSTGKFVAQLLETKPPYMLRLLTNKKSEYDKEALAAMGTSLVSGLGTRVIASYDIEKGVLSTKEGRIAAGKLMAEGMGAVGTSSKLDESDIPGGIVIGPKSYVDVKISYKPSKVEKLDSVMTVKAVETRQTFPIYLTAQVGVPKLSLEPYGIMDDLDFGIGHIGESFAKNIFLANEGTVEMDFKFSLMQKCSHRTQNAVKINNVYMTPSNETAFSLEGASGVLAIGQTLETKVIFKPEVYEKVHSAILVCSNGVKDIMGYVNGVGGKAIMFVEENSKNVNFGLCRMNHNIANHLKICNIGNLGFPFKILEEGIDKSWVPVKAPKSLGAEILEDFEETESDKSYFTEAGFSIESPSGYIEAKSEVLVTFLFSAQKPERVFRKARLSYSGGFEDIILSGRGGEPLLNMYQKDGTKIPQRTPEIIIDLGTKPVYSKSVHIFYLVNNGSFPSDFMIQPWAMEEFSVAPTSGRVQVGDIMPLKVTFKPKEDSKISSDLKVIWESSTIEVTLAGKGGMGKLSIEFSNKEDLDNRALTFNTIPLNAKVERSFYIHNKGSVPVHLAVSIDMPEFKTCQISDAVRQKVGYWIGGTVRKKDAHAVYSQKFNVVLPENSFVEVGAAFQPLVSTTYVSQVKLQTEFQELFVPISGKGGTYNLSHKGSLQFGDTATNFLYSRKIILKNEGSITSKLAFKWSVGGDVAGEGEKFILPCEIPKIDPRSRYASTLVKGSKIPLYTGKKDVEDIECTFSAKDYWRMLRYTVLYFEDDAMNAKAPQKTTAIQAGKSHFNLVSGGFQSSLEDSEKRLMLFYHLIRSTPVGETSFLESKVEVIPSSRTVEGFSSQELDVQLTLNSEQAFSGSLLIYSDVPQAPVYEIPIQASPRFVSIIVSSTEPLNFGLLNIGNQDEILRKFKNIGNKTVIFELFHENSYLQVFPKKGVLKKGEEVDITFVYKPLEEIVEDKPVTFLTECTEPMEFPLHAGGGISKLSLSNYEKFDFGNCMMDKDTIQGLPVYNVGNAVLQIDRITLANSEFFKPAPDWPKSIVKVKPGSYYNIPISFNPPVESPDSGLVSITANNKVYDIVLVGTGRESVLLITEESISFKSCLVGNTYYDTLEISNVGDVNYPLTFAISKGSSKNEKAFEDCWFDPQKVIVSPFSKVNVKVIYKPSLEMRRKRKIKISSPYSEHEIPILFMSGRAPLIAKEKFLNFGIFDKNGMNKAIFHFHNAGTVTTRFKVSSEKRPHPFKIKPSEGIAEPGAKIAVELTYIYSVMGPINETIFLNNEDTSPPLRIPIKGHCEESKVKPEEFREIHMGDCGVMEVSAKQFTVTNYGKYPLSYDLKFGYPIKVSPQGGQIDGNSSSVFTVQWCPSGSYEVRSVIKMETESIGNFDILVKGRAAFPEFIIQNSLLDFGVCAVNYPTTKSFTIVNRGKVTANWTIPSIRDGYFLSAAEGSILAKGSQTIDVVFVPTTTDKYFGNFIVEARGHYKELSVIGIGGVLALRVHPCPLIEKSFPVGYEKTLSFKISNEGEADVIYSVQERESLNLFLSPIDNGEGTLKEGKHVMVKVKVRVFKTGAFKDYFIVKSPQKLWKIYIYGFGITVHDQIRSSAESEVLRVCRIQSPLTCDMFFFSYLSHCHGLNEIERMYLELLTMVPVPQLKHCKYSVQTEDVEKKVEMNKPKRHRRLSLSGVSASANLELLSKITDSLKRENSREMKFTNTAENLLRALSKGSLRRSSVRLRSQSSIGSLPGDEQVGDSHTNEKQGPKENNAQDVTNGSHSIPTQQSSPSDTVLYSGDDADASSTVDPVKQTSGVPSPQSSGFSSRSTTPSEKRFLVRNMINEIMGKIEPKLEELLAYQMEVTHEMAVENTYEIVKSSIKRLEKIYEYESPPGSPDLIEIRNIARASIEDIIYQKIFQRLGLSSPTPTSECDSLSQYESDAHIYMQDILAKCFPNVERLEVERAHEMSMQLLDTLCAYSEQAILEGSVSAESGSVKETDLSVEDVERDHAHESKGDCVITSQSDPVSNDQPDNLKDEAQPKAIRVSSTFAESNETPELTESALQSHGQLPFESTISRKIQAESSGNLKEKRHRDSLLALNDAEEEDLSYKVDAPLDSDFMTFLETQCDVNSSNWSQTVKNIYELTREKKYSILGNDELYKKFRRVVEDIYFSGVKEAVMSRAVEDDKDHSVVEAVINYPKPNVHEIDMHKILGTVEPHIGKDQDRIDVILLRPPPFHNVNRDLFAFSLTHMQALSLERKKRNAPTTGMWADYNSSTLIGQGVNYFRRPGDFGIPSPLYKLS